MRAFDYVRPTSLTDAVATLREYDGEAKLVAGGTSLLFWMREGLIAPCCLVDVSRLQELAGIREDADGWISIGAGVTHADIESSAAVCRVLPFVAELERDVGTVQMRNRGTVGGNLCHADPSGDLSPAFLALDADVEVAGADDARRLKLEEFLVGAHETALEPTECLQRVRLRRPPPSTGAAYVRFVSRMRNDFTLAGVATVLTLDATGHCARLAIGVGGVAPHAFRAREAEARALGEVMSSALASEVGALVAAAARPFGDHRGSEEYKRTIAGAVARRSVMQAWQRARTPQRTEGC